MNTNFNPVEKDKKYGKKSLQTIPIKKTSSIKKSVYVLILFGMFWLIVVIVFLYNTQPSPVNGIFLKQYISNSEDIDGDGIPNWLEIVKGTNPSDSTSFTYKKEIEEAIAVTELEQSGPSKKTSEILRRILDSKTKKVQISEEEARHVVKDAVEYFSGMITQKSPSTFVVQIDNTIDRKKTLMEFAEAVNHFSSVTIPVEKIVLGTLSKREEYYELALAMQLVCGKVLKKLPRRIPQEIYSQYTLVTKRIVDSCAAVEIALSSSSVDSLIASLQLLTLTDSNQAEGTSPVTPEIFLQNLKEVITILEQ